MQSLRAQDSYLKRENGLSQYAIVKGENLRNIFNHLHILAISKEYLSVTEGTGYACVRNSPIVAPKKTKQRFPDYTSVSSTKDSYCFAY